MRVVIRIPIPLRGLTNGQKAVEVEDNEDFRVLHKDEGRYEIDVNSPVEEGDQLSIVPPIAGGSERNSHAIAEQRADRTL